MSVTFSTPQLEVRYGGIEVRGASILLDKTKPEGLVSRHRLVSGAV